MANTRTKELTDAEIIAAYRKQKQERTAYNKKRNASIKAKLAAYNAAVNAGKIKAIV